MYTTLINQIHKATQEKFKEHQLGELVGYPDENSAELFQSKLTCTRIIAILFEENKVQIYHAEDGYRNPILTANLNFIPTLE